MPIPKPGESESNFVGRCVGIVIHEGTTSDPSQAAAICHSIYRKHHNKKKEETPMPYPNEHACRLQPPGKYKTFKRNNCYKKHEGKCMDFIFGKKEDGNTELQAIRYPSGTWTAASARSHCQDKGGSFEKASGKAKMQKMQKVNQHEASTESENPTRLQTDSFLGSRKDWGQTPTEEEIRNAPLPPGYNPNRMHEQDLDEILPISDDD